MIGAGNDIPWRIPEDWQRFKRLTMGQVLIMGRKTYDSIGRPLPGRTTFVITRDRMWRGDGVRAVPALDEAFDQAALLGPATIFVAGGGEIYRAAWDRLTGWRSPRSTRAGGRGDLSGDRAGGLVGDLPRGPRRFQLRELPARHAE